VAAKKTAKKSASTSSRSKSASTSKVKVKDLSPRKNPRGGDRPHQFTDGGSSADE
jgi:hypothetical protein